MLGESIAETHVLRIVHSIIFRFQSTMSEIDIVVANTNDRASTEKNNTNPQATQAWWAKMPWATLCVGLIMIICCILEYGYDIPKENIRWNAFLRVLFNCAGLWAHFLPNLIACLVVGSIIELVVGSVYMTVVVVLSYTASVLYSLVMYEWIIQPVQFHGYGFSIVAYQWFTICFAALFLHYWWRPFRRWRAQQSSKNADGRFGTSKWWMGGIFLCLGGGWILHFTIKGITAQLHMRVNDHAHVWAVIMGYPVCAVIAMMMWCEHCCRNSEKAERSKCAS